MFFLFGAAAGMAMTGAAAYAFLRPLRTAELMGRAALRQRGFQRVTSGGLVSFRAGRGPTVVLLHGVNDQAGGWYAVAPWIVAAGYRVVIPDLPGHGDSAPQDGPLSVEALLAGVATVLGSEPRPAVLVGNSMGGWLSVLHTLRQPADVAGIVLVNGAAVQAPPAVNLLARTRDEARAAMAAVLARHAPPVPWFVLDDLVRRAPTSPLARMLTTPIPPELLRDRLAEITCPTALVWGADDRLLDLAYAERVQASLRGATLQTIPGAGHMPQRDQPAALVAALLPVLKRMTA